MARKIAADRVRTSFTLYDRRGSFLWISGIILCCVIATDQTLSVSKGCGNLIRCLAYSGEMLASSVIFTLTFATRSDLIVSTQHEQKS
jgi:hypothetical protein